MEGELIEKPPQFGGKTPMRKENDKKAAVLLSDQFRFKRDPRVCLVALGFSLRRRFHEF
jgi:hypothetical protein